MFHEIGPVAVISLMRANMKECAVIMDGQLHGDVSLMTQVYHSFVSFWPIGQMEELDYTLA
jgi:hypothetical protein